MNFARPTPGTKASQPGRAPDRDGCSGFRLQPGRPRRRATAAPCSHAWNLPFYSLNRISNFLDGNPDAKVVYGPADGGRATFLGTSPASQHSGAGAQATGNISGWDPENAQTSSFTSIIFPDAERDPFVENWFVGVQREVVPRLTVEINYVGTAGRKLFRAENVNRSSGSIRNFRGVLPSFQFEFPKQRCGHPGGLVHAATRLHKRCWERW
jgi:hypothetical protein